METYDSQSEVHYTLLMTGRAETAPRRALFQGFIVSVIVVFGELCSNR